MRRMIWIALAALLAGGLSLQGAVIVDDTWDSDADGWVVADPTTSNPYTGSDTFLNADTFAQDAALGGEQALKIAINGTGLLPEEDHFTDGIASGDLTGNWAAMAVSYIEFDFYSDPANPQGGNGAPEMLRLYFLYDSEGDDEIDYPWVWYYDINVAGLSSGWNYDIFVPVAYGSGWYNIDITHDNASDFATSLVDVDEVGIMIRYEDNLAGWQTYGLDDFELHLPEPGTYGMLGFALVSVAATFRRKLNAAWASVTKG